MIFSMFGQEKCDLLVQVTAWAGLTVCRFKNSLTSLCSQQIYCLLNFICSKQSNINIVDFEYQNKTTSDRSMHKD
jgi:hypothetical protein